MKTCPNCNHQVDEKSKFCPECGCKISNNKSNVDDLFKIDSTIDNKINKCDDVAYK